MFMTNEEKIWACYNKASAMIESCRTIGHLLVTRQHLKQFHNQVPQNFLWMIQNLDARFDARKKTVISFNETHSSLETKKTNKKSN